ncbi:MAG: hypothetical protein DMG15_25945 [Acidobacteria bacterium]|nr:MAG: hypothetical protein DMG16_06760 [Acidobacteriota bacterium]PYS08781.1 MAG: hypothetical protein DMG15_25945 [Acidobacteriota bacterium]
MVVVQRNEVSRNRVVYILTIILSVIVLSGIAAEFSQSSQPVQVLCVVLGAIALLAIALSLIQLFAHPKRSQVLLFQRDDEMVLATNAVHEGFKLRFLRDILGEQVTSFTDEDRLRWKSLESDGFYAALYVRNVRKVIMLRLCTMIFDDVFVADRNNRWEHHDSSSTAEPSYSKREMPPLTTWKSSP